MSSDSKRIKTEALFVDIPIDGTGSAESVIVDVGDSDRYSYWCKVASAGSPDVSVEFLVGYLQDKDFVIAEGKSAVSINDKVAHVGLAPMVAARYAKVKATGVSANPSDTTISLVLMHG